MNVGLLYTPVSIYQMTRGALVLFVGVLSVVFLHRHLRFYQSVLFISLLLVSCVDPRLLPLRWLSLVTVMLGE